MRTRVDASPLLAPARVLERLPRTFLWGGALDPLASDLARFAARLRALGGDGHVLTLVEPDAPHYYVELWPFYRPERARWKYLVVGIIGAFGAAAAVGVLLETFDPVLVSTAQMEAASDLPVLDSVPRIT